MLLSLMLLSFDLASIIKTAKNMSSDEENYIPEVDHLIMVIGIVVGVLALFGHFGLFIASCLMAVPEKHRGFKRIGKKIFTKLWFLENFFDFYNFLKFKFLSCFLISKFKVYYGYFLLFLALFIKFSLLLTFPFHPKTTSLFLLSSIRKSSVQQGSLSNGH